MWAVGQAVSTQKCAFAECFHETVCALVPASSLVLLFGLSEHQLGGCGALSFFLMVLVTVATSIDISGVIGETLNLLEVALLTASIKLKGNIVVELSGSTMVL